MATTAYATGAHLDWRRGLSLKVREAPLFYTALALSLLLGAVAAYSGVSPIRLLFTAGIVGAVGTPLGLAAPDGRRRQAPDERPHPPPWPEGRRLDHHHRSP